MSKAKTAEYKPLILVPTQEQISTIGVICDFYALGVDAPATRIKNKRTEIWEKHTFDYRCQPYSSGNTRGVETSITAMDMQVALLHQFTTETLFTMYKITDSDGNVISPYPRVNKGSLDWWRSEGREVWLCYMTADIDCNPHDEGWTQKHREVWNAIWNSGHPLLATCGVYFTPRGLRLIQPLSLWYTVEDGEQRLRAWLAAIDDIVKAANATEYFSPASACKDWTRLMRTPGHSRTKTKNITDPRTGRVSKKKEVIVYLVGEHDYSRASAIEAPKPIVISEKQKAARQAREPRAPRAAERARAKKEIPPFVDNITTKGWAEAADDIGIAIRDTVKIDWHMCGIALSGALLFRGCPLAEIPSVVTRAHQKLVGWEQYTHDWTTSAEWSVSKWIDGFGVPGYSTLKSRWPEVADALDRHFSSAYVEACEQMADPDAPDPPDPQQRTSVAASVVSQLSPHNKIPTAKPLDGDQLSDRFQKILSEAYGVTIVSSPCGAGKTRAVAKHADSLPHIGDRATPGSRVAITGPTIKHNLETCSVAKKHLRVFGPSSLLDSHGDHVCIYAESGKELSQGGQSHSREYCRGHGREPCEKLETCPAASGQEGDENANLLVGTHKLAPALDKLVGTAGIFVVDEPPELVFTDSFTIEDVREAEAELVRFGDHYVRIMGFVLKLFIRYLETAVVDGKQLPLLDCLRLVWNTMGWDTKEFTDAGFKDEDADDDSSDIERKFMALVTNSISPLAKTDAPPIKLDQTLQSRKNQKLARKIGTTSNILKHLYDALMSDPLTPHVIEITGEEEERRAVFIGFNQTYVDILLRQGRVVVLDAFPEVHMAAIVKILKYEPKYIQITANDGAPIERTVYATKASRARMMPSAVIDWECMASYLRHAIKWVKKDARTVIVGLILPKIIETYLRLVFDPNDAEAKKEFDKTKMSKTFLARARKVIGSQLSDCRVTWVFAHFGGLRGLNNMSHCDAIITIGDPRPSLNEEDMRARYLGLTPEERLNQLGKAELGQAHGRLRTIHRTVPGRALHIGSLLPYGWEWVIGVDNVEDLDVGRPRSVATMSAEQFEALRVAAGLTVQQCADELRCTRMAVWRYASGDRVVPTAIAEAMEALASARSEAS